MNKSIFDIRFLAPPTLTLILIFLFSPDNFLELVKKYSDGQGLILAILTLSVFVLGILISGIVELFIKGLKLRSWHLKKYELDQLDEILKFKLERCNQNHIELAVWLVLGKLDKEFQHLQEQIQKRWYWTTANFNLLMAVVLAIIFVVFYPISSDYYKHDIVFAVSSIILIFVFLKLGISSYNSVCEMHRFVISNFKKMIVEQDPTKAA